MIEQDAHVTGADGKISDLMLKVVGVTHENLDGTSRQEYLKELYEGKISEKSLSLERDPQNEYDRNAIMIMAGEKCLGFVSKEWNETLAALMDHGSIFEVEIWEMGLYPPEDGKYYLHILVHET